MSSNGSRRRTPEKWDREGVIENIIAPGINLYHYQDFKHGIMHYVLVMLPMKPGEDEYRMDRQFHYKTDPDVRKVLDGARGEWEIAQKAKDAGDTFHALIHTYRGLRIIFPHLPEDLSLVRKATG